jgi:hypothetical protein
VTLSRAGVYVTLALLSCDDSRLPAGAPCTGAASCATGLCLTLVTTRRVCAQRCADDAACAAPLRCGRFDFRGRDDAGAPAGDEQDIVRVCRPPLDRRCAEGCDPGERCVGGADGVCARRCASPRDCGGRDCVDDGCGGRACAPPCDALAECPRFFLCDQQRVDADGHGQCVSAASGSDAAVDAGSCAVDP